MAVRNQRPKLMDVIAQYLGCNGMATRRHPVDIARECVDFAVVGDHAERVRQVPGREGVGGKALMHQSQGSW